ncbi:hypothetical protein PG991_003344 [Apiospora marii]|uniref:Uncharacterized protein n=1 Tax=Apiospora marii TaxID=335849 RepID=A0ABR1SI03_9PEZI
MIPLRWIILVGCTAISAVTAATLGAIFQQQKQREDKANNDNNSHHDGLPCCTCKGMRDQAARFGTSLDEFFRRNPNLDRNDCNGNACANNYTQIIIPNIVGGSPNTFCRTVGGDVTRATSGVVTKPSNPTTPGYPSTTTAVATVSPSDLFKASVVYSTREPPPATEASDSTVPQSTGVASSFPAGGVVSASPSDAETQHTTFPGPVSSLYKALPIISGDTTGAPDSVVGASESPAATSKARVPSPINMPVDTDELSNAPSTGRPTRLVISGSLLQPSITAESDHRTPVSSSPETRTSHNQASKTPGSQAETTSKARMSLPMWFPLPEESSIEKPTMTETSGDEVPSSTATGRDHWPDLPSSETRTSDNPQASETPDSTGSLESVFTTYPVTTTALPTSIPPKESSIPFSSEPISSSGIAQTFSTSPGEPTMSASTFPETYPAYFLDVITTATSSSPNSVFTAYSTTGTARPTLEFLQEPSRDKPAGPSSDTTRASVFNFFFRCNNDGENDHRSRGPQLNKCPSASNKSQIWFHDVDHSGRHPDTHSKPHYHHYAQ